MSSDILFAASSFKYPFHRTVLHRNLEILLFPPQDLFVKDIDDAPLFIDTFVLLSPWTRTLGVHPRHREAGRVERWTWIHEGSPRVNWGFREPRIQYGKVGWNPPRTWPTVEEAMDERRAKRDVHDAVQSVGCVPGRKEEWFSTMRGNRRREHETGSESSGNAAVFPNGELHGAVASVQSMPRVRRGNASGNPSVACAPSSSYTDRSFYVVFRALDCRFRPCSVRKTYPMLWPKL